MSKKCGDCRYFATTGSSNVCTLYCSGISEEECCRNHEAKTIFDHITVSPEVLAENLVYRYDGNGTWRSFLLYGYEFLTKEEAYAATVAKLKEKRNCTESKVKIPASFAKNLK